MSSKQHQVLRKGWGWGLYDFGTSAYFLVFPLYLFPVYLSEKVFATSKHFELIWGLAQGCSLALAVIAGIIFAEKLDSEGLKRVGPAMLVVAALSCCLLPLFIGLHASPFVLLGCYVFVHSIHLLSLTIYDSSIVRITAPGTERASVSGWAWGWGYVGGLTCMGLMEIGLRFYPRYSAWDFSVGSAFYLFFAVLAARWLRNELSLVPGDVPNPKADDVLVPIAKPKTNWKLLLSMVFIVDGIAIFMSYTGLYGTRVLHLPERQMTLMLALLQLLAFPLTGIIATVGGRNVPKTLLFCGLGWIGTVILLLTATEVKGMFMTIVVVSAVVGTTQALLRSLYSEHISGAHPIKGFSRYAVVEKGAAFLGPVIAGIVIPFVGYKPVIAASGISIMIGSWLVWRLTRNRSAEMGDLL